MCVRCISYYEMHRTQLFFKGLKDVYLFEIETIKREYNGLSIPTPR